MDKDMLAIPVSTKCQDWILDKLGYTDVQFKSNGLVIPMDDILLVTDGMNKAGMSMGTDYKLEVA